MSDRGEERSGEEMVVDREESEQREDDSGSVEEEEGETVEGRDPDESEDAEFAGARRTGQSGHPPFSDEEEMDMLEFIQAHTVLFTKKHVHYFDKVKKDRLWDEIGRRVGRTGHDVCETLFREPTHQVRQAHQRPGQARLRQEVPED